MDIWVYDIWIYGTWYMVMMKRGLKPKKINYRNKNHFKPTPFFLKNRFNPNFKKQYGKNPVKLQ